MMGLSYSLSVFRKHCLWTAVIIHPRCCIIVGHSRLSKRKVPEGTVSVSELNLDSEFLGEFLVPVPDGDLGHTGNIRDLSLRPALVAHDG